MEKRNVSITRRQLSALECLAYWRHELAYLRERGDKNDPEYRHDEDRFHKTILMAFDELDKLGVSFLLQNAVVCWTEDWRAYMQSSTLQYLKTRFNVTLDGVTA